MSGYRPSYLNVFLTFARNSLVRDMSFRTNFILQCISTISWTVMNIGFYLIVFQYTDSIGKGTGWGRDEFFVFLQLSQRVLSARLDSVFRGVKTL